MTELIGDIILICTGGTAIAPGGGIPTVNIAVSLGTNVTSRLLGSGGVSNASEAVLLVDEPNTSSNAAVSGVGPTLPTTICPTPGVGAGPGGCAVVVSNGTSGPGLGESAICTGVGGTVCSAAPNVFQGLVSGNQVTFLGVPVNPPASAGIARVYRITNVRANTSALGGGGLPGTTQLLASVSITGGSTALPVTNPVLVAGFIQSGLSTSLRNTANSGGGSSASLAQCGGGGPNVLSTLRFSENFGTAFKTRVAPVAGGNGQGTGSTQNVPGTIYNSESGLVLTQLPGGGSVAGLADYGTRLKAVFNNVPAGVRLFVSTANVTNGFQQPVGLGGTIPGTATTSYAQLVISETAPDGNGFVPAAIPNSTITFGSTTINIAEIPIVSGTGTAVWEVINTNPSQLENLDFAVYQQFTANPGANSPPVGTATVNLSYAPTPSLAFSASAGATASSTLTIPRFADTSSATNIFSIALCQTVLLYPYVTNIAGFDTGLAIANTSTDPFGTRTQQGSCTMNFYGAAAPPPVNTGNIASGTVYAALTSTAAAGFNGYMIAVCNFQLAHGFAFISDLGARNLAMGYLALVVTTGTGNRNNLTEALNN
jgi:hypothetical protein